MRVAAAVVVAIIALASTALAATDRDDELARNYAFAFSTAFEAQQNCPGMATDDAGLTALREAARLGGEKDDRAFLTALFKQIRPFMEQQIAHGAQAWCKAAYDTYGPHGLHVLHRR